MNADVVGDMIFHLNQNPITFTSNDARAWELAVHGDDVLGVAQPSYTLHAYLSKKTIKKKGKNYPRQQTKTAKRTYTSSDDDD